MSKLYAILYAIILGFAIVARAFDCLFEAMLESRCISLSFGVEVFCNRWKDERYYTPINTHWDRVKEYWDGV